MTNVVIGSGPSGYAAVSALLDQGKPVTVVDVGQELEPQFRELRAGLANSEPAQWRSSEVKKFKQRQLEVPGGLGRFGSAHAVRSMSDLIGESSSHVLLRSSHAKGGLSNVWGAAVLPWSPKDTKGWPVPAAELAEHYKAVSGIMPVAGQRGRIDQFLETPEINFGPPLPVSLQAACLLRRLSRVGAKSGDTEIWTAPARQAVADGCRSCGLCLYGCPYGLIFTSAAPIDELKERGAIQYIKDEVKSIAEAGSGVEIHLRNRTEVLYAERVFLAAGVLETARIIFSSRADIAARGVTLQESRHFFTPFLAAGAAGRPDNAPHHTLALAFVDFRSPAVSPWLVHTQIYGWNDFFEREMTVRYGRDIAVMKPMFRWLSRRLFVGQTFLHSEHCPRIELRWTGDPSRQLHAKPIPLPEFEQGARRARKFLARRLRRAGLFAVSFLGRMEPPGASFHTGCTFPMAVSPGPGETDGLGRLAGTQRIHIVDASILPEIPSTTITLSVMANAHRIASLA